MIEAGIEEALTQIHYGGFTNLANNGWTYDSALGSYTKTRDFTQNRYTVSIRATDPPVITSSGYVRVPLSTNWMQPRTVVVTTGRQGMFAKGMVAKGAINLNGNNIRSDSFDSMDPNYSTGGRYDGSKIKAGGDVATNSGLVNAFSVGNANILGKVSTGPGGSVSIGSNGKVGDVAWQNSGNSGIQPGWSTDDMNVSFPDVVVPTSAIYAVPGLNIAINGITYDTVYTNGVYRVGALGSAGTDKIVVTGNATIIVTNSITLSGQDALTITTNGSLKLYMTGASTSLAGNGIVNMTGNAMQFSYYGSTNNTSLSLSGNAAFTGSIYAPSASFTLSGGGNNTIDFVGASVTGTVTMNGHYNFHYDENLGRQGQALAYVVLTWNEI